MTFKRQRTIKYTCNTEKDVVGRQQRTSGLRDDPLVIKTIDPCRRSRDSI